MGGSSEFFSIPQLRTALATYQPHLVDRSAWPEHTHAAVALLLRQGSDGVELLFILRAEFPGDPGSGNIAFPGGHIEIGDETIRAAAERETFEELGIDLQQAEFLGRLDDVAGAHLPVIVSCFSYVIDAATPINSNQEINETFWVPLATLADPNRQRRHFVTFRGEELERPAIDLLGPGRTVLWGITYRLVSHFMQLAGVPPSANHDPLMRTLRSYVQDIEFASISLHYRLTQPRILPPFPELMPRRALLQAGIERLDPESFERLFTPPLPEDPTALRRYQRPAPPFAFQPYSDQHLTTATETAIISCHLFGDGITLVNALVTTLEAIQPFTFAHRQKDGTLIAVTAADASGKESTIWQKGMIKCAEPPRITAAWHLDSLQTSNDWQLEIISPARLMVQKKPLFQPGFRHLLPFILRRVTALCYFYSHLEIEGVTELLATSTAIEEETKEWQWDDWRRQSGDGLLSELGGVYGHLRLKGPLPDELVDLLRLGSLMNIGKGAAYGAGAYRLLALS